ncbi:MAG TPA: hypothetical protein VJX23_15300 [Candidatus Binataceae bacterium]|nr:hypothetical protein [Candidatus Binataceae bacterium]
MEIPAKRSRVHPFLAVLLAETVILQIAQLPLVFSFDFFAFSDTGANLVLQYLLSLGYKPTIDFFYPYGLLPLLVGNLWFRILGATPTAVQIFMVVCGFVIAWALSELVRTLQIGLVGKVLAVVALGYAINPAYPNLAHAMEAAIIATALSRQASGHLGTALSLAIAAIFVKPALGYVYSGVLVAQIVFENMRTRSGMRALAISFAPAVITAACLVTLEAAAYGPSLLPRTLLPISGMANYRTMHYGFFFGIGRNFWRPPGARFTYYLGTSAGFFLAGTAFLMVSGLAYVFAFLRSDVDGLYHRRIGILLTCGILELAFVTIIFGNAWSWYVCAYPLVFGIVAAADLDRISKVAVALFCLVALLGYKTLGHATLDAWLTQVRTSDTRDLWASPAETAEWQTAVGESRLHRPAVIVSANGAAGLMFPEFDKPVGAFLFPAAVPDVELHRTRSQILAANTVVLPLAMYSYIPPWCFDEILKTDFETIRKGQYFEVLRRKVQNRP